MTLKRRLVPVALTLSVFFITLSGSAQAKPHRVVFALTSADEADWKLLLGNIRNLLGGLPADSVETEVVVYGPGLALVRTSSSASADLRDLLAKHVHFVACENSMRVQHVTAADLLPGVTTVSSGVVEVVTKEEQGWSYVKAGR